MNLNFSYSLIKYYYKNIGLSYINSILRANNIKLLFIKILEKKKKSVLKRIIELLKKYSGHKNKSIYNKNAMINNFFIKKGYSYIQAVERENYLSYSLLNKFICIIINSKLRIIISQFKNNYHYLIFKNVITKLKKNKILNTTNEIKYNKLELLSKKKKLDTNIEIGTYKYFFDKYINNKYNKNIDNENKITKLNTEKDNYKINRRHSVSFRPSPIVNLNKNYKQTRRFSMVI